MKVLACNINAQMLKCKGATHLKKREIRIMFYTGSKPERKSFMKSTDLTAKAAELLKQEAVIITAAEYRKGILERAQLYFWSEGPVMDIVTKDDLVQNWPDTGVYAFDGKGFHPVAMFEGEEDMFFRVDGTKNETDDLGTLPSVLFMETVEGICGLK